MVTAVSRPRYRVTPTGKITVKAGSAVLCTLTLAQGGGHCTLGKSRLRPGTYSLIASYAGGREFAASASAKKTLTVAR
jgi:Bacterial Ig-like domain (group 3)